MKKIMDSVMKKFIIKLMVFFQPQDTELQDIDRVLSALHDAKWALTKVEEAFGIPFRIPKFAAFADAHEVIMRVRAKYATLLRENQELQRNYTEMRNRVAVLEKQLEN